MKVQGGIGRAALGGILAALLVVGSVPVGAFSAAPTMTADSVSLAQAPLTFDASLPAQSAPQPIDEPPTDGEAPAALRVLAQDDLGIELEFVAPELEWVQAQDTEGPCELPIIKGFGELGRAGAPALPAKVALVGTPGEADLELQVLDVKQELLPETHRICPAATPQLEFVLGGIPEYLGEQRVPDADVYALSGFAPEAAVELLGTSIIRGQRVAEIRYMPLQYDPSTGQVRTTQRVRVRLQFGGSRYLAQVAATPETPESTSVPRDDAFDAVLRELLVNYEAARAWRAERAVAVQPAAEVRGVTNPQFKVTIRDAGLYRITYDDLTAEDPDYPWETVDPHKFHLRNRGIEVALRVEGESDSSFDPGDSIIFYGEKLNSKYALDNVYFLTWDDFDGLRMNLEDGTPGSGGTPEYFETTKRVEVDVYYQTTLSSGDNDYWYWDVVAWSGGASRTFSTQLLNVVTAPVSATIRGVLHGFSANPMHQVRVLLNSHQVYSATWATGTEHAFSVEVPSAYVLEGTNTIVLNRWGTPAPVSDIYFVNWFELDYTRSYMTTADSLFFDGDDAGIWKYRVGGFTSDLLEVYDITNPVMPVRITGAQTALGDGGYALTFERAIASESHYLALATSEILTPKRLERDRSSSWFSPDNAADYIIITSPGFMTATQPLVDYHISKGLRVEVVDVQDIYDEFGGGWLDPVAIRDFVAYAYAHWEVPAPAYVLLVGDGNFDYKDNMGHGERNYVPPYLADVDPWMGETAVDNRYVAVDGSDIQPDLHLGRLPGKTAAEVTAMVSKTLAYAADTSVDAWKGQLLFAADDPDEGGDFRNFSNAVADYYVPAPYTNQKIYYGIAPYTSGSIARAGIVNAIKSGKLIVNYVGHSAISFWASEQLMNLNAIASLTNTQTLPFIMPMTCHEGYYVRPSSASYNFSSFGETIVRKSGGGAIASWSPTGLGVANGHDIINKAFFQAVFYEDLITFGPATTLSKLALIGMGHDELIDTYILFGDPALKLNTLPADVAITKMVTPTTPLYPGDWLTYTLAFTNTGPASANNVVIEDVFPSMLLTPTVSYSGAAIVRRPNTQFVWDVADLTPGASGRITVTARVPLDYAGTFTNTAIITTTARELASATGNNSTAPIVVEVVAADVEISKIGPSRALPGETIQYVLTYGNTGTTIATGVVITDLLHSHLLTPAVTFAGPTIMPRSGQNFVWDVDPLPPGAQGRITITANVDLDYRGTLTNQAEISTTAPEVERFDNISALISTAVLIPDLVLEKTGPAAVLPGMDITYVVSYTNRGNATATGVVITDVLPAAVGSVMVLSAGMVITPRVGSAYVWDVADIAPDSGGVITITGTVSPAFRGDLVNTASIVTELPDNNPANNVDTLTTFVSVADLTVIKTGPAAALAGERITYTLAVANADNAPASGVVLTDTLPADLLDVTVTASVPGVTARPGSAYVWDMPDLMPGASVTLIMAGRVSPAYRGTLSNQAMVATASPESLITNNTSALVETFVSMADVMVEKTGPATVQAGGMVTYTLRYNNVDNGVATGVVLTDVLPSSLVSATVVYSGPMLTQRPGAPFAWTVADLAPGAGGVVTITAFVRSDATGAIVNTASIAAVGELNTGNNNSTPVSTQILLADVTLNKSAPATVESGAPVTYRLTFTNTGTTTAYGVVITDLLPVQLTGVSFTSSGAGVSQRAGAPFVWDVVDLAPGASGIITITAMVDSAFTGMLINAATIATSSLDSNPSNNSAQVSTQVTQPDYKIYLPLVMRQYP